jgi:hypothetical protein
MLDSGIQNMVSDKWQPFLRARNHAEHCGKTVPNSAISCERRNNDYANVTRFLLGFLRDFIQPLRSLAASQG